MTARGRAGLLAAMQHKWRIDMKRASRTSKARRQNPVAMSPQARRRQRTAKAAVRRDTTLLESPKAAGRVEVRMAPPRYAERRHARPGAGIKRSRANMAQKSR
jgi:hypothetical protein